MLLPECHLTESYLHSSPDRLQSLTLPTQCKTGLSATPCHESANSSKHHDMNHVDMNRQLCVCASRALPYAYAMRAREYSVLSNFRVSYRIFCWRGEIWCTLAREFCLLLNNYSFQRALSALSRQATPSYP